jgi:hypothetical protein
MSYNCEICLKEYSSYKSLWKHNKTFHSKNVDINKSKSLIHKSKDKSNKFNSEKIYECNKCNKVYKHYQSRWKHEQKCNEKSNKDSKYEKLEEKVDELRELLLQALSKPKNFQKINNQLNNSGTIINMAPFGLENLNSILNEKEKLSILNEKAHSLREIIKLVHLSDKYPQFNNISITNLQNNIAYKYDEKSNSFIAVNKNDLLDELIDCRNFRRKLG